MVRSQYYERHSIVAHHLHLVVDEHLFHNTSANELTPESSTG